MTPVSVTSPLATPLGSVTAPTAGHGRWLAATSPLSTRRLPVRGIIPPPVRECCARKRRSQRRATRSPSASSRVVWRFVPHNSSLAPRPGESSRGRLVARGSPPVVPGTPGALETVPLKRAYRKCPTRATGDGHGSGVPWEARTAVRRRGPGRRALRSPGNAGRALADAARDAGHPRRVDGVDQGHRRQAGGEPPGSSRRPSRGGPGIWTSEAAAALWP
jgi:hypothetical protein